MTREKNIWPITIHKKKYLKGSWLLYINEDDNKNIQIFKSDTHGNYKYYTLKYEVDDEKTLYLISYKAELNHITHQPTKLSKSFKDEEYDRDTIILRGEFEPRRYLSILKRNTDNLNITSNVRHFTAHILKIKGKEQRCSIFLEDEDYYDYEEDEMDYEDPRSKLHVSIYLKEDVYNNLYKTIKANSFIVRIELKLYNTAKEKKKYFYTLDEDIVYFSSRIFDNYEHIDSEIRNYDPENYAILSNEVGFNLSFTNFISSENVTNNLIRMDYKNGKVFKDEQSIIAQKKRDQDRKEIEDFNKEEAQQKKGYEEIKLLGDKLYKRDIKLLLIFILIALCYIALTK